MTPQDHKKSKAPKIKTRIRPDGNGGFMAYSFFGCYAGYGNTIERAFLNFRKLLCELT